jgi:hypothetical protein
MPVFNSYMNIRYYFSKNYEYLCCFFSKESLFTEVSIKSCLTARWFHSEGKTHLLMWHPPVCDVEMYKKGGCYHDKWNCKVV